MTALRKIGLVAALYLGAVLVAVGVVAIHIAATNIPDRDACSGMYAFGDSLFFLAAFGVASVPATSASFIFLRPHRAFWRVLSVLAFLISATAFAALITYIVGRTAPSQTTLGMWTAFSILRLLVAPIIAGAGFLSCLFAPHRQDRIPLLAASLIEAGSFAGIILVWVTLALAF
jgi:hypothetical protein